MADERWEYRIEWVKMGRNSEAAQLMNEFGADGWEAYFVMKEGPAFTVFFKRRANS